MHRVALVSITAALFLSPSATGQSLLPLCDLTAAQSPLLTHSERRKSTILCQPTVCQMASKSYRLGYPAEPEVVGDGCLPAWVVPSLKLRPWFDDCQSRIEDVLTTEPIRLLTQPISCTFLLKPTGDINDLFVWQSTGSRRLDEKVEQLIRKAAPFQAPPDELLHNERLLVTFLPNQQISLKLDLRKYDQDSDSTFQIFKNARK